MKRPPPFFAALFATCVVVTALQAADWPGFRGPQGNGTGTDANLPDKWTKDNFLFKVKLPGPGGASPITSGDKLFVLCYTGYGGESKKEMDNPNPPGKGGGKKDPGIAGGKKAGGAGAGDQKNLRRLVLCFDAGSGKQLWQQEVEPSLPEQAWGDMVKQHGYSSNTPVTDGERLYVFFGKVGVFAFDFTGKQLWKTSVGTNTWVYGSGASLALHKNLLIVNAAAESKALIALDKITGQEVWRNKDNLPTWSTPLLVKTKDGKDEMVVNHPYKVVGYDPDTGKQLWYCTGITPPDNGSTYNTPVAKDGVIYVVGGGGPGPGGAAVTFAIRSGGQGDVTKTHLLWSAKGSTQINSPVIAGKYLYTIDGFITCTSLEDGKTIYKQRLYSPNRTGEYPSAVVAGDRIIMVSRYDGAYVLATGNTFKALSQYTFEGDLSNFTASPAISNGRLYVRSDHYLYCIGKKS